MCAEKNQQILNASMVKTSQVSKLAEKSKQLAKSNGYMFEIERYKWSINGWNSLVKVMETPENNSLPAEAPQGPQNGMFARKWLTQLA